MNINISNYNNVDEFKKEFTDCLVEIRNNPLPFNVKFLTEETFDNKSIVGIYHPKYSQWFTTINTSIKEPEMITIPKSEYNNLIAAQKLLDALEANGVDNWEGYYDSIQYAND